MTVLTGHVTRKDVHPVAPRRRDAKASLGMTARPGVYVLPGHATGQNGHVTLSRSGSASPNSTDKMGRRERETIDRLID